MEDDNPFPKLKLLPGNWYLTSHVEEYLYHCSKHQIRKHLWKKYAIKPEIVGTEIYGTRAMLYKAEDLWNDGYAWLKVNTKYIHMNFVIFFKFLQVRYDRCKRNIIALYFIAHQYCNLVI